jgi:hypothetical protein
VLNQDRNQLLCKEEILPEQSRKGQRLPKEALGSQGSA